MPWKTLALLVAGLTGVALTARPPPPPAPKDQAPLLPRKEFLHALGAAVQPMVADLYWLEAIQQMGYAHDAQSYGATYYYVDLATDLAPLFYEPYPFGAVSVTYNLGHEHWVNTDESTHLLHKGLQHHPKDSRLRFMLAYNLMYYEHRFREAGDIVKELSRRPHAPKYLAALATRLYAQSGAFDSALTFAQALRDSARDEASRKFFEKRIREIHLEKVLQEVDAASAAFRKRTGRLAHDVDELIQSGLLRERPQDPLGGEIRLDSAGRGESTSVKHRLQVYGAESSLPQN
jgi:hypothetical protein